MGVEMDKEDIDSSSEESLGSEGDDQELNDAYGNPMAENDALLDSSDDSNDSDPGEGAAEDMDVDEDLLTGQLAQVNDQLAENPYAYELYAEKIKILKRLGDLDKLRETREKFNEMYPLSETIWLDWLRDEIKLACTEEETNRVQELFERAISDYLSVELWLEYISFCMGRMKEENGQQKCREIFERALGSCGIHVSMGSLVWDMYRDYEAALLGTVTTEEELQAQENRFTSLCRRQLSVPLLGMTKTYQDIKSKIEIDDSTEIAYKKALERLSSLETWEGKLIEQQDKPRVYRDYIEDEKKAKSNPARIQCLYERAIADFPLESSFWLEYLDYLSKNLKIEQIILDVAYRASRNCSWDINIWLTYMHLQEVFCEPSKKFDAIKSVFEKAILYCSTGESAGTVWLKYLEFLRRRVKLDTPSEKEVEILRKTFEAAEQHLLQLLPEPNEYVSEVLLFRARFESQLTKGNANNEDSSNIWKEIINRGYGQCIKTWLQYIMQEVSCGSDVRKLRSLYAKAVSYVKDDFQTISNLWINFERDHGDLASLKQCESKISQLMAKNATELSEGAVQSQLQETRPVVTSISVSKGTKRKINDNEHAPSKKGRQNEDTTDGDKTASLFKVPSLPDAKPIKKEQNVSLSHHGESIKHDSSKDNRTVFLSNLAFTTNEKEICEFFNDIGVVEEVRLVKDYRGRSKGFGYVFFTNEANAKAALGKDRQLISGRPAFVSKCDPDKTTRQKQFKYPTKLETNKLFIKGLPLTFTADELRDMFKVYGDLKDCRLVTYRNGHSKGLAYVEYIDEACAKQALLKTDGTSVGDKQISVAVSNPPVRDSFKSNATGSFTKTAKNSESLQRRTPKAFVPRSLQISNTNKKDAENNSNSVTPKSNAEFRNLFLK